MRFGLVAFSFAVVSILVTVSGAAFGAESAFRKVVFARGFDHPVLLTYAPGEPDTVYVLEQPGRVIRLRDGRRSVFLDIRNDVRYGGELGLLGLAFDPEYVSNRRLYIAYTSKGRLNTVARFQSSVNGRCRRLAPCCSREGPVRQPQRRSPRLRPRQAALHEHRRRRLRGRSRQPGAEHALTFRKAPDPRCLEARGDVEDRGPRPEEPLALLLRPRYRRPLHRRRRARDDRRGELHVPLQHRSRELRLGHLRRVDAVPARGRHTEARRARLPGLRVPACEGEPVLGDWGFVYRGPARPAARGRYIFGDYCSGTVWSFRMVSGAAEDVRTEPFRIGGLTSFGEDTAGELYATSSDGVVYRLTSR